jgi:Fe2+ or Zn2+ uptake regulation protein
VCQQCGHQQEISHDVMHCLFDALIQRYGFQATCDHLLISGLCKDCLPHSAQMVVDRTTP